MNRLRHTKRAGIAVGDRSHRLIRQSPTTGLIVVAVAIKGIAPALAEDGPEAGREEDEPAAEDRGGHRANGDADWRGSLADGEGQECGTRGASTEDANCDQCFEPRDWRAVLVERRGLHRWHMRHW